MKTKIYLAGPMRGIKDFNFPAFHEAEQRLRRLGYDVFSAASYEEALFGVGFNKSPTGDLKDISMPGWDFREAFSKDAEYITKQADVVAVLPGWERSKGAQAEVALGRAIGLQIWDANTLFPVESALVSISDSIAKLGGNLDPDELIITDPETGGKKGQKQARFDLIPAWPLWELARLYGYGCTKYADDNWRKGYSWKLSFGALMRHLFQWLQGERDDRQTGCHHLASVAWHAFTLMWFEKFGKGTDDRSDKALNLDL